MVEKGCVVAEVVVGEDERGGFDALLRDPYPPYARARRAEGLTPGHPVIVLPTLIHRSPRTLPLTTLDS